MKEWFKLEKKPFKGLFALEWVMLAYMTFTLALMLFYQPKLVNPDSMIGMRMRILFTTAAMYLVYRMVPCRVTRLLRVGLQVWFLGNWYPDTYEFNRILPNLDHVFAQWEQCVFGYQPALLFSQKVTNPVFSELMDLGYASYYPLIALTLLFYFFRRYDEFLRASFIMLTSFFIYYVVFIFLPVAGPTFYYLAVGLEKIAEGVFPSVGDYFNTHQACMPTPGYEDGFFYYLVEVAKEAGERPTAAFPSSHVGVTTVLVWLAWHTRSRRLFFVMLPFAILMFFATFYIQAHYAIDAIAGVVSGTLIYFGLLLASSPKAKKKR